jgi:hypothetical protein
MRLTLRTLLAYLDRSHLRTMLSSEEAHSLEALGEKIAANEFASSLVERIHSSVGRQRLGAPKLDGRGMGLDPNTVAEFLDNSLAQQRMQEFEKVCLESDVHLAEVAACHQILSLVLAERPEIPPGLRERMREMPQRQLPVPPTSPTPSPVEQPAPVAATPLATTAPPTSHAESVPQRPLIDRSARVPEYLRRSRRTAWKPLLATVSLLLLLLVAGLLAMGNLDESHPLLGSLLADRSAPNDIDVPPRTVPEPSRPEPAPTRSNGVEAENGRTTELAREALPAADASPREVVDADEEDRELAGGEEREPTAEALAVGREHERVPPPRTEADVTVTPEDELPAVDELPPSDFTLDPLAGLAQALTSPPPPPTPSPDPSARAVEESDDGGEMPAEVNGTAREVGRMIPAERDPILARWDTERQSWFRLPGRSVLSSGDRLLVLPSFRPQVALSSGIHIMLVGPAKVDLGLPDTAGVPRVGLDEGRALLDTAGIAGSQLHLRLATAEGTLTFESADSAVALEVRPLGAPGDDPGDRDPIFGCEIYTTTGDLTWRSRDGSTTPLKSGQILWLVMNEPPVVHDAISPPRWLEARDQREIDLRASRELAQLIDTQRPISLALFEQVGHRQTEVGALAIESLALLTEFDPLVQMLRNERHQSYWRTYIGALESAIRRGPETAEAVRAALAKQQPEEAGTLYRLLYGYHERQLAEGGAQELVALLESPSMEVRVLAIENLRRITNRTWMYRPEREPIQQRKPLQDWRNALNRGEITYRSAAER